MTFEVQNDRGAWPFPFMYAGLFYEIGCENTEPLHLFFEEIDLVT
jgi:hypothetical protein